MKKRNVLKVFSLLTALCMVTGCKSLTEETQTQETEVSVITTVTTENVEETEEIKYCEIPEGMTFEDLCGLFYYKDAQIRFPCTLNEFLALDKDFVAGEYEEAKSFTCIYKYDNNGVVLDFVGMNTIGDLNSYEDISKYFIFNTTSAPPSYSFYQDVLSFNGVHYGDDFLPIKELLGKPSHEETGYCNYSFCEENKSIFLEFRYTDNGKFLSACFGYTVEEN